MSIKYIVNEEEKRVVAVLNNTKYDAYNKAMKMCKRLTDKCPNIYLVPNPNKMMMPNSFHGITVCHDDDVFDLDEGKRIAKRICLEKYYASFDKKMDKFTDDMDAIGIRIRNIPGRNDD